MGPGKFTVAVKC